MKPNLPEKPVILAPALLVLMMSYRLGLNGVPGLILTGCLLTTVAMLCIAYCRAHDAARRLRKENACLQKAIGPDPWNRNRIL